MVQWKFVRKINKGERLWIKEKFKKKKQYLIKVLRK